MPCPLSARHLSCSPSHLYPQEDSEAAASINSDVLLVPWPGDGSTTLVDRFDARLLLDSLPAPGAGAAAAAQAVAEAEQMDSVSAEAMLERERWRSLPAADHHGSGDSESSSDGACARLACSRCAAYRVTVSLEAGAVHTQVAWLLLHLAVPRCTCRK